MVVKLLNEYAIPALAITNVPEPTLRPVRRYGSTASAPITVSEIVSCAPVACPTVRLGAVSASTTTPPMIAPTPISSRRPIGSCNTRDPISSNGSRPAASIGCTSVSGASISATICTSQPTSVKPVPTSQRRLFASRCNSDGRSA